MSIDPNLWSNVKKQIAERVSLYCSMVNRDESIIKIKDTPPVDDIYVKFAIMGLELNMGWVNGKCEGWSVQLFVDVMNSLTAEYFGVGTEIPLQKWIDATEHVMDSFTDEVYKEHNQTMTADIIRKRLRDKFDKPIKLRFKKKSINKSVDQQ